MVPSEIRSAKACKFCIVCINYFCQQAKWLKGRNKMCIDAEAATGGVLQEKVFLEILQNSQQNTCARISGTGVFL